MGMPLVMEESQQPTTKALPIESTTPRVPPPASLQLWKGLGERPQRLPTPRTPPPLQVRGVEHDQSIAAQVHVRNEARSSLASTSEDGCQVNLDGPSLTEGVPEGIPVQADASKRTDQSGVSAHHDATAHFDMFYGQLPLAVRAWFDSLSGTQTPAQVYTYRSRPLEW